MKDYLLKATDSRVGAIYTAPASSDAQCLTAGKPPTFLETIQAEILGLAGQLSVTDARLEEFQRRVGFLTAPDDPAKGKTDCSGGMQALREAIDCLRVHVNRVGDKVAKLDVLG